MASELGRGAQVRLDGDVRQLARGGVAQRLIDNIREKLELEAGGTVSNGLTPDGSAPDGTAADDELLAPGGIDLITPAIAAEVAARIAGDTFTAAGVDATSRTNLAKLRERVTPYDYGAVGDGVVDDGPAVQRAVNAAKQVDIVDGTFRAVTPVSVPSNTTINGAGGKITKGSDVNQVIFSLSSVSHVRFVGVRIDNTGGNLIGPSIQITNSANIAILGGSFVGGYSIDCVQGVTRLRVEGNDFDGARSAMAVGTTGLTGTATTSSDIVFAGNHVRNMTDEAVDINDAVVRCAIANNTFRNCGAGAGGGEVVDIGGGISSDITVSGNTFDLAGLAVNAITVKVAADVGSTTTRVALTGNTITGGAGTTESGIYLKGPSCVTVAGNTIDGTHYGVYVGATGTTSYPANDVSVTGNVISVTGRAIGLTLGGECQVVGNRLVTSSTTDNCVDIQPSFTDWLVANNTVVGGLRGICPTAGASPGAVNGNDVSLAQTYGIFCLASKTVISANRVHDNGGRGIAVQNAANCTASNNVITDNATVTAGSYGLVLLGSNDGAVVTGNLVTGLRQNGLSIAAAADRVILTSNYIYGNAGGTNITGATNLTNSVNANNITA